MSRSYGWPSLNRPRRFPPIGEIPSTFQWKPRLAGRRPPRETHIVSVARRLHQLTGQSWAEALSAAKMICHEDARTVALSGHGFRLPYRAVDGHAEARVALPTCAETFFVSRLVRTQKQNKKTAEVTVCGGTCGQLAASTEAAISRWFIRRSSRLFHNCAANKNRA